MQKESKSIEVFINATQTIKVRINDPEQYAEVEQVQSDAKKLAKFLTDNNTSLTFLWALKDALPSSIS